MSNFRKMSLVIIALAISLFAVLGIGFAINKASSTEETLVNNVVSIQTGLEGNIMANACKEILTLKHRVTFSESCDTGQDWIGTTVRRSYFRQYSFYF